MKILSFSSLKVPVSVCQCCVSHMIRNLLQVFPLSHRLFFAQISFDYIQNMSSISCFQTRISRRTYKSRGFDRPTFWIIGIASIIAGRKHVDYKVPLFLGWKRKINSWQKKRGQNWIVVTQHKMVRSSSFQERKIFAQL